MGGNGGDALGGIARIGSDGGTIRLFGDLLLDGGAIGGDGVSGGDATARVSPFSSELDPTAISIYANGGGSVSVEGMATLDAQAVGGSGSAGNGGNAQGGEADIVAYAGVSGDTNPVHLDEDFAKGTMFKGRIAHGMLSAGFISAVIGTKLPGAGMW